MADAERKFQSHIAHYLQRNLGYGVLEQGEITDQDYYLAEDHLLAFIRATQPETLARLEVDYSSDAPGQILAALRDNLARSPLWLILRKGLEVRGHHFHLYGPKPRSGESAAHILYGQNRFTFKAELVVGDAKRPDLVLFLNGLPVVVIELKHEASKQNVHDAVSQFNQRNPADRIFQLPFLYVAADTSDVKVATDPRREENFRWFNTGLENHPQSQGEYPVEFLYREVLAPDALLEAISFFLVYVPRREAEDDKPERPAYSIFPRYHQSRMVRKVADQALANYVASGNPGGKYLVNHSAGSGKTLSISWLADRLHSLYKPGTGDKLVNIVFILTDRKSLDKNIRDELANFGHLAEVIVYANEAALLAQYIRRRESIIVTTQQKFLRIVRLLEVDPSLKDLRVAFLIDEAHRSQDNKMGTSIRVPFRATSADEPDEGEEEDEIDPQEETNRILRAHDLSQLFVAFTATPSNTTVQLFGDPCDTYSEAEAIQEGYIVDVAASIISYETLYHLHSPVVPSAEEQLYPAGVIAKALKNVAFQDEGLIQYKAEVMLRIFDDEIRHLIGGRAKAMIVTCSRLAGLTYYTILKEKLKEKAEADPERFNYQVLYAFSDFVHPDTNKMIREVDINGLQPGEEIEDRFEGDDYRLLVVANKFQTGFDQPLLAGMFLDKPVVDRNAVQTVSRLNRCHADKNKVVVVDFTNNAAAIHKAFNKYRKGTPYESSEPDNEQCMALYDEIVAKGLYGDEDADRYFKLAGGDFSDARVQAEVVIWRGRFNNTFTESDERKVFVHLLAKFVKSFNFLSCFFEYPDTTARFAAFAGFIGPQLIKLGSVSDLMKQIRQVELSKATVKFRGVKDLASQTVKTRSGGGSGNSQPPPKISLSDMIEKLRERFAISDNEALVIKEVCQEKMADPAIASSIQRHANDGAYLWDFYKPQLRRSITESYEDRGLYEAFEDPKYTDDGSIFDTMAFVVIQSGLEVRAP